MSTESKWYELGQIRYWSETYDVYKLFGVYFIRLHYKQVSFMTGREIPRRLIEVHPNSLIAWHISKTVDGKPETVWDVLAVVAGAS